jgi:hypothetical protein
LKEVNFKNKNKKMESLKEHSIRQYISKSILIMMTGRYQEY